MSFLKIILLALLIGISGCRTGEVDILAAYYARLDAIPQKIWDLLAQKKIFFGHKSVGVNILAGLNDVMARVPAIKLNIRETASSEAFDQPVFAHALLGTNMKPLSKIEAFRDVMESGVGRKVDIAFFKLCFVDIDYRSDLQATFDSYRESMERLRAEFPNTIFVTFTVPLMSQPIGLKPRLNKLLGRLPGYKASHIQRNAYNDLLRKTYSEALFDLADIETRTSDTERASFRSDGERYDILHRAYTDDGGHLNPLGRQIVAIELLLFLAALDAR